MTAILTVTLNPALDVTTSLGQLHPMRKLRCGPPRFDAGGGGVNVSRAIKTLGGESRCFVTLGGHAGAHFRDLLDATGISTTIWPLANETRMSLTVMENTTNLHYRFVMPGPEVDTVEAAQLQSALLAAIDADCRFAVLSGTLPPGMPADFYAEIIDVLKDRGIKAIVDTCGPALAPCVTRRPYLIKLNRDDALCLAGDADDMPAQELADLLQRRGMAETVVVTTGAEGAFVAAAHDRFHLIPPHVPIRSMVGAGDSFVGAMTLGLTRDWPLEKACRYGVAAAASAVTTEATELCQAASTQDYFERTRCMPRNQFSA